MITFTLFSPDFSFSPGQQLVSILLESDIKNGILSDPEPTLLINDVLVDATVSRPDTYSATLQFTTTFIGGQNAKISAFVTEMFDGERSNHWMVTVTPDGVKRLEDYMYSPYMDSFTSYLPPYLKAANDKYSVFQQLLNPVALELDRVKQQLVTHNRSLLITSTHVLDPDWLTEYNLQAGESFFFQQGADGQLEVVPPSVWGISGVNRIALTHKPTFTEFWTDALPSRFISDAVGSALIGSLTPSTPLVEAQSVQQFNVPLNDRIYVEVHSSSNLTSIANGQYVRTVLLITGQNEFGEDQQEEILLFKDGTVPTNKFWGHVDRIELTSSPWDIEGEFIVHALPPRLNDKVDTVNKKLINKNQEPIIYSIGTDDLGSYISTMVSAEGSIIDIAKGASTAQELTRARLSDINGDDVTISDFCLDPINNRVYGVDSNKLYIWDRRNQLPSNLSLLSSNSEDPEIGFMLVEYNPQTVSDGSVFTTISVELERPRENKTVREWCWSIVKDNGDVLYLNLEDDSISEVPFWKENPMPISFFGIKERDFEINLDETGDYIFVLDVVFTDNTTEKVQHPIQIHRKKAIAEYYLDHLMDLTDDINRVHMSPNGRLILSNAEMVYILKPAYDLFMIDADGQRLLFRESFDQVEVRFNE